MHAMRGNSKKLIPLYSTALTATFSAKEVKFSIPKYKGKQEIVIYLLQETILHSLKLILVDLTSNELNFKGRNRLAKPLVVCAYDLGVPFPLATMYDRGISSLLWIESATVTHSTDTVPVEGQLYTIYKIKLN